MKLLVDDNIAKNISEYLKQRGFEILPLDTPELTDSSLVDILGYALKNEATYIFHNKYFNRDNIPVWDKIAYGIVHMTIDPPVVEKVIPILKQFFTLWKDRSFYEKYVVVGNESYRIIEREQDEFYFYY